MRKKSLNDLPLVPVDKENLEFLIDEIIRLRLHFVVNDVDVVPRDIRNDLIVSLYRVIGVLKTVSSVDTAVREYACAACGWSTIRSESAGPPDQCRDCRTSPFPDERG